MQHMNRDDEREWNLIMQLQEKIDKANRKIDEVFLKIEIIQTLIRDYNGIRERIDACESRLDRFDANREGERHNSRLGWEKLGYITGVIGASAALLSILLNR